jgi:hypothetical protein
VPAIKSAAFCTVRGKGTFYPARALGDIKMLYF